MKWFILAIFLCSCTILQPTTPIYTYKYKVVHGNLQDSVFHSNVLYYPGDTIVEIPSRNTIVIKDIKFYKQ